jgi:hypothetical protein
MGGDFKQAELASSAIGKTRHKDTTGAEKSKERVE